MRKRNVWRAIAVLAALYAVRAGLKAAQDVRRYNHMRSLSNEGPILQELPELMLEAVKRERQTVKELMNFAVSFPKDLARYMKIEQM